MSHQLRQRAQEVARLSFLVGALFSTSAAGFTGLWHHRCPAWKLHSVRHRHEACAKVCGTWDTPACAECPRPLQLNRFKMCVACGVPDQPSCVAGGFVYACCAARQVGARREVLATRFAPTTSTSTWGADGDPPPLDRPRYWAHRPQQLDVPVPCSNAFGGCSTYQERWEAYSRLFSRVSEDRGRPTDLDCGFAYESVYDSVLERTTRNPECETVVYIVNFGAYDHLRAIHTDAVPPPSTCFFLFVDTVTKHVLAEELAQLREEQPFWKVVYMPSFPISAEKSARTLKILAHRFFPHARRSLYFDGKVVFRDTVLNFLDGCLANGSFVGEYGLFQSTREEVVKTYAKLLARTKSGVSVRPADLDELNLQYQQYRLEGYSDSGPRMNTLYLARNHTAHVKLLECAWFNEVDYFSHREQVSLPHAASAVGLSHIVRRQRAITQCGDTGISQFGHMRPGDEKRDC